MLGLPLQLGAFFLGISTSNLCVFNPFLWVLRAAERDQILSRFSYIISKLEYYPAFVASLIAKFWKWPSLQSERCCFNLPMPKSLNKVTKSGYYLVFDARTPSKCEAGPTLLVFRLPSGRHLCSELSLQRGCGIRERTGLGKEDFCAYTTLVSFSSKLPGHWVVPSGAFPKILS